MKSLQWCTAWGSPFVIPMHCSPLEMHSCTLLQVKACWCFSLYDQEALSWHYCCSQLLSQGRVWYCQYGKSVFFFWYLYTPAAPPHYCCVWAPHDLHYLEVQEGPQFLTKRSRLRATKVHGFISCLEPACPSEFLGYFVPWFWPKSTGTLPVSGNGLGALWGWDHFPYAVWVWTSSSGDQEHAGVQTQSVVGQLVLMPVYSSWHV